MAELAAYRETPVVFACEGEQLVGIVTLPAQPSRRCGVLILVGGPQYRVGAHRQFVHLARHLAAQGIPAMRFDFRGMGDGSGSERTFRYVEADIAAAISAFQDAAGGLEDGVVLWGLCGGSSAACLYPQDDPRVTGLILVNPWLTAKASQARVRLKHYYARRLLDPGFWRKLLGGRLRLRQSLSDVVSTARAAGGGTDKAATAPGVGAQGADPLPGRMLAAISTFAGRAAIFLSGRDYVAKTFEDCLMGDARFQALQAQGAVAVRRFTDDDHTFSSPEARARIEQATSNWVLQLPPRTPR